jgi:hypothetical protein
MLMLCSGPAALAQASRRRPRLEPRPSEPPGPKPHYPHFTDAEIRAIRDYYAPGSGNTPPGPGKNGALPPALRKQLYRRGVLPPDTDHLLEAFPETLVRHLPPPPKGYRHALAGGLALLIEEATGLIVDTIALGAR